MKYKSKKSKKKAEEKNDEKISGGIIIGWIETVCGVLLLVRLWKKVGSGLIVDGVRRMLNTTEEIAKQNEQKELEKAKENNENSEVQEQFAH